MKENLSTKIPLKRSKEYSPSVQEESELLEIMAQTRCSKKAHRSLLVEGAVVSVWHLVQQSLKARHFRKDEPATSHLHLCKTKGKNKQEKLQSSCCLSSIHAAEKYWASTWNY